MLLYKFGGKEYQDEFDINTYDFGARNYDPALGRWMNIDPLAELSRKFSPYAYALDNPIFFIDPDGMEAGGFANINPVTSTGSMDVIGGFDVNTVDKQGNVLSTEYHANVNDAENAASAIDATIDSNNTSGGDSGSGISLTNKRNVGGVPGLSMGADGVEFQHQKNNIKEMVYNGQKMFVFNQDGEIMWEGYASSGSGEHMNNPNSQNIKDYGPIPEGEYTFNGNEWNSQSPVRQLYNLFVGNGDWGDFNVKLNPITYNGSRNNFYLHGGKYPGSAGCIDLLDNIKYVRNLTYGQDCIKLTVKYAE